MRFRWVGIMVVAGILAGCGGGSGDRVSSNGASQSQTNPTTYVAAKPTVSDYYTYKLVAQDAAAAETSNYFTVSVNSVGTDGAYSVALLYDAPTSSTAWPSGPKFDSHTSTSEYDGLGHWLATKDGSGCTISPAQPYYGVAPLTISVGMSWQYSGAVVKNCSTSGSTQTAVEIRDSAIAQELVTVAAGTFNTIKVTRNSSEKDDNSTVVVERNCWWEPDLGIEVKCVTSSTKTITATSATISHKESWEMLGYSNQRLVRKADTVVRFAGTWKGSYFGGGSAPGGYPVQCALTVDVDGSARGYCLGMATSFGFTGNVGADGTLSFIGDPDYPGMSFTGKLDSLQQMSGTWSIPPYLNNGTWTLTQD